jgi:hypothetical protein
MTKFVGKFTAPVFFKVENGGKILADGIEIDGAEINRFVDADTGGSVSARGAKFRGRVGEVAVARNQATVDLTDAIIKNIGANAVRIDPGKLASKLTELLGEEVSVEAASKIIGALKNAEEVHSLENQVKKLDIWKVIDRVGGIGGLIQLITSMLG